MTPEIYREIDLALAAQREHLPRIRREVVSSLHEDDTLPTILQRVTAACMSHGVRMTQAQMVDYFASVVEARQERFPSRPLFNCAGI